MSDLVGGQIDLICDQTPSTAALVAAGKVKAFGVTTARRLTAPVFAGVPTLDEAGLKGFGITNWHALYAPRGTPRAVVERLNEALRAALKNPAFIKREEEVGAMVITDARSGPAEHRRFLEAELAKWIPVIKGAGQYAD